MAGAVELGQGYVSLAVSTRGAGTEINRMFGGASRDAKRHGAASGRNFSEGFRRETRNMFDIAKIVAVSAAFRALSQKGMPDLTFGIEGATRKATLLTGALVAATAAGAPLLGLVGGLAAGLASAGAGAGAFAALVAPAFKGVTEATAEVTKAETEYKRALASGDAEGAQKALESRRAALLMLTPEQRKATEATVALKNAFVEQSKSFAVPALNAYTRGVGTLQGLIPQLTKVATPASEAILGIFDRADKGLKGEGFVAFTDFLAKTVGPTITKTSALVESLGSSLVNIWMAATPGAMFALDIFNAMFDRFEAATAGPGLGQFFEDARVPMMQAGELIENLVGFFGNLISAAMPIAGPVLGAVNDLVYALRGLVNSSDFVTFVFNIGDALELVAPLFEVLATQVGKVFAALSGQLLAVLPVLIPAVADFATALADVLIGLSPLLPSLIGLVAALVSGVLPAIYPVVTIIRTALVPVVDLLTKGVEAVTPYIDRFVKGLQNTTAPGGKFREVIGQVAGVVMNLAERALPYLVEGFRIVSGFIRTEVLPRVIAIGKGLQDLYNVVAPIVLKIVGVIVNTFRDNLPLIRSIFKTIGDIVKGALDFIRTVIGAVTKVITKIWDIFGDGILRSIRIVFTAIMKVVSSALKIVRGVISLATNLIKGNWKGAWEDIKGILKNALDIVKTVLKAAFGVVRELFGSVVRYVKDKFTDGMARAKEAILKPIREAKDKLSEMLGAGKSGMITLFNKAVTGVGRALDAIKEKARAPINFVIGTIYNDGLRKALNLIPGVNLGEARLIGQTSGQGPTSAGRRARGGLLSGHTPGIDVKKYTSTTGDELHLSGGEAVMVPQFADLVGGAKGVDMLNDMARKQKLATGGVFSGGAQVVPGAGKQHSRLQYPWARWAGDFANPMGTPVYAWKDGTVNSAKSISGSYGNHLRVQFGKTEMLIAHLSRMLVGGGQRVTQGQKIGEVGSTGNSTGPHAHIEFKGGVGKIIAGIAGAVGDKVMSWIGSPTEKILSGLKSKMGAGVKGDFADIVKKAGSHAIDKGIAYAKNAPAALWNQIQSFGSDGAGATANYMANNNSEQMKNAATIASAGSGMGRNAQIIGIATAIVESGLRNVNFGDRDSLGLFQQRAPWGPASVRTNPRLSAEMFFHGGRGGQPGLDDIRGWQNMPMGTAAQRVQVSAFPGRYAQEIGKATSILGSLSSKKLAKGGMIDPQAGAVLAQMGIKTRLFDTGGYLEPNSATLAVNGTNRRERVGFEDGSAPLFGNVTFVSKDDPRKDMDDLLYKTRVYRRGAQFRPVD